MNTSPTLSEICDDHNRLVDYVNYVANCIDRGKIPLYIWEWDLETIIERKIKKDFYEII